MWLRALRRLSLIAAGLYLLYGGLAFVLQREMLFAGRRRGPKPPPAVLGAGVQSVWLDVPQVGRVEALYIAPPAGTAVGARAPSLLFAHGNAELIEDWPAPLEPVNALGLALLIVEYPGYGRSDGEPDQDSISATMLAAHDFLSQRPELDPTRIVGFGRSLGGGAICTLIGRRPLAALVLSSAFTGVRSFAGRMGLPAFLVRDRFDNLAAVQRFEGPVLVVHGTRDQTIPYAHGEQLARAAKHGRLLSYPADHNDCPPDWTAVAAELRAFFGAAVFPR